MNKTIQGAAIRVNAQYELVGIYANIKKYGKIAIVILCHSGSILIQTNHTISPYLSLVDIYLNILILKFWDRRKR